jgi:hypothetical protein
MESPGCMNDILKKLPTVITYEYIPLTVGRLMIDEDGKIESNRLD